MELNPKCIKDVLLYIEENSTFDDWTMYRHDGNDISVLAKYDHDEILYHIHQCHNAGLIAEIDISDFEDVLISDLTPRGHEFLTQLKNETVFKKICSSALPSIPAIIDAIASLTGLFLK